MILLFNVDNLPILREHNANECNNLIYLSSSINSSCSYNVLIKDEATTSPDAYIAASGDLFEVKGLLVS